MREITDDEFEKAIDNIGSVLVYFFSTFCPPCKTLGPVLERMSQDPGDVEFVKINIDEHMLHASRHRITSVPTLVLYKAGFEAKRNVGAMGELALRDWLTG